MSGSYSNNGRNISQSRILFNQRGLALGIILCGALAGFEIFNFSTTQIAVQDLLGEIRTLGISWATILTIAFCGIDFAGIARLFIPEELHSDSKDTWYLFGAWLIAATMNAVLTWWGVSLAINNRTLESAAFINPRTLTEVIPVFIALMIWVTRILLIGSLAVAGPRLFSEEVHQTNSNRIVTQSAEPAFSPRPSRQPVAGATMLGANNPRPHSAHRISPSRPEPEYIPDPSISNTDPAYVTLGRARDRTQESVVTRR